MRTLMRLALVNFGLGVVVIGYGLATEWSPGDVVDTDRARHDARAGATCCSRPASRRRRRSASSRPPASRATSRSGRKGLRKLIIAAGVVAGRPVPRLLGARRHGGADRRRGVGARQRRVGRRAGARHRVELRAGLAHGRAPLRGRRRRRAGPAPGRERHDARAVAADLLAGHEPPDPERDRAPAPAAVDALRGRRDRGRPDAGR